MTVGQRRGMGHGHDGTRRYVTSVDVAARRVTVGSAEQVLRSSVLLREPSLTWVDRPLPAGARRGGPGRARTADRCPAPWCARPRALAVHFDSPQRAVAPGQTVALYDASDPDAVIGAGIAA